MYAVPDCQHIVGEVPDLGRNGRSPDTGRICEQRVWVGTGVCRKVHGQAAGRQDTGGARLG